MIVDYISLLYIHIVLNLHKFVENKLHKTNVSFPICKFDYMNLQHHLTQIPALFLRNMFFKIIVFKIF